MQRNESGLGAGTDERKHEHERRNCGRGMAFANRVEAIETIWACEQSEGEQ